MAKNYASGVNRVDRVVFNGLVTFETQKAICFRPMEREDAERLGIGSDWPDGTKWIPRSMCYNGDNLSQGDSDIEVARWWVDRQNA